MDSHLDMEITDMLESKEKDEKNRKDMAKAEWLKANKIKTERMRSVSQSTDYSNILIDLDLYRTQNISGNNSSNDSSFSNSNTKTPSYHDTKNTINAHNSSNTVIENCNSSPVQIQPKTITKSTKVTSPPTPMSSLLLSTSLSLHDNRASRVGPEEFIELVRRKQDFPSSSFCRPGNRRRTVSENQASLKAKFPQSLRLKFITETNHPIKKDIIHQQPINKDIINHQPISKDSTNSYAMRKKSFEHAKSLHAQLPSRTHHQPPSSLSTNDSMSNYPKLNVGSPTSPYSELLMYGRSPSDHLIFWKEANKRKIIKLSNAEEESIEEEDEGQLNIEGILETVLRKHSAYDVMDKNSRVIILDLDLKVGSAFDAIAYDCIHAAPLWDSRAKEYVGMLTMTDFIVILQQYIGKPGFLSTIRNDPVRKWRDFLLSQQLKQASNTMATDNCSNHLSNDYSNESCGLTISSNSSLEQLANHLLSHKVHRVLVVDPVTHNALFLATHRKLIAYIWAKLPPLNHAKSTTHVFNKPISLLSLGTYTDLVSVNIHTPVNEVFSILLSQRLSAIPVVNDNLQVVDLFRKADVMSLMIDGSFNDLYKPVQEVLSYARNGFEGLYSCKRCHTAYSVISAMVELQLHRVVILDREGRLEGVITISDVINLLLRADAMDVSDSD